MFLISHFATQIVIKVNTYIYIYVHVTGWEKLDAISFQTTSRFSVQF